MKRFFVLVLSFVMMISVIPYSAFADEMHGMLEIGCQAEIDDTGYDTFDEAVRHCGENDTIDLLMNVDNYTPPEGECFTVRKNGFYLNMSLQEERFVLETENIDGTSTYHDCSVDYIWSADYSDCTARAVCRKYPSHVVMTENGTVTRTDIPAGCTEDGRTVYTATFENLGISEKTVFTGAAGHIYINHKCVECGELEDGYLASGECGPDAVWALDENGILTVSGTGTINGDTFSEYSSIVTDAVIDDAITEIEADTFKNFVSLNEITLPSTLKKISSGVFDGCSSLALINCDVSDDEWNKISLECDLPESAVLNLNSRLIIQIGNGINSVNAGESATVKVTDYSDSEDEYVIGDESGQIRLIPDDESILTVSGNEITGISAGQTAVSATLIGDRYGRTVSTVVNVVENNPSLSEFYLYDETFGKWYGEQPVTSLTLDAEKCKDSQYVFIIGTKTEEGIIVSDGLTYTSTDSKVAKLSKVSKGESKGCYQLTIPKNASGACTVTAAYTNKKAPEENYSVSLSVKVMDYAPRIESSKLTLNSYQTVGVSTALISSYGNEITGVAGVFEKVGKAYSEEPSDKLTAECANGILTIKALGELKNQTINAAVKVNGRLFDKEVLLTVTVKNSMPKITIKQASKLNLFYNPGESNTVFSITAKDAVIDRVEFDESVQSSFDGEYKDGLFTVTDNGYRDAKGKPVNGSVIISLDGYKESITQKLSVAAENRAPALKLSSSSCTMYVGEGSTKKLVTVEVLNKDGSPADIDKDGVSVASGYAEVQNVSDNRVTLELTQDIKTNVVLEIRNAEWSKPVSLKYTINVAAKATDLPTLTLSKKTLTINRQYPDFGDSAEISLSQSNTSVASYSISEVVAKGKTANTALRLSYDAGKINVSVFDNTILTKGSYSYQISATLKDGRSLKPVKFTVSVIDAKATATLKSSGKMDLIDRNNSMILYSVSLKNIDTEVTDVRLTDPKTGDTVEPFDAEAIGGNIIRLTFNSTEYSPASYKFVPVITIKSGDESTEEIKCAAQTVKVTQSAFKVLTPAAQTVYQSQNSARVVTYRISASSPIGAEISSVQIGKADVLFAKSLADAASNISFSLSKDRTVLTVKVTLNDMSKLVAGKTYTLPLVVVPNGAVNQKAYANVKLTLKVQK